MRGRGGYSSRGKLPDGDWEAQGPLHRLDEVSTSRNIWRTGTREGQASQGGEAQRAAGTATSHVGRGSLRAVIGDTTHCCGPRSTSRDPTEKCSLQSCVHPGSQSATGRVSGTPCDLQGPERPRRPLAAVDREAHALGAVLRRRRRLGGSERGARGRSEVPPARLPASPAPARPAPQRPHSQPGAAASQVAPPPQRPEMPGGAALGLRLWLCLGLLDGEQGFRGRGGGRAGWTKGLELVGLRAGHGETGGLCPG